MASGGPLVPFLEVNLFEGKDLPALNKMNPGSDPYVILYLASKPKDRHKSKIFKQEVNPKWNETFVMKLTDVDLQSGRLNDNLVLEVYNFSTIGKPKSIGDAAYKVSLAVEDQLESWVDLKGEKISGKGAAAQLKIGVSLQKLPLEEIPVPIKSHTGNSVESFYNSVTRTIVKKARKGDRNGATTVTWLDVTVIEGKGFAPLPGKKAANPYVILSLNSSDRKRRKGKVAHGALNPIWKQNFGFEVASVVRDKMEDGLKIFAKDYNLVGSAGDFGQTYVPLNTLAENGQQDLWVPVGSNGAQVHLLLKRYQRKVEDLESDSLLDKLNARLLYFLNLARLRLGDMGFDIKLSVEVVVAAFSVAASIMLTGKVNEEQIAEENAEIEEDLESTIEGEEGAQSPVDVQKEKGFAVGRVEKIAKAIGRAVNKWTSLGLKGEMTLGATFNMFQTGFTIGVTVAMA
jgi:hypothetical protein